MNELDLIRRIRRIAGRTGLVLGIGDDCAIYRPRPGEDLLFTTDQMVEGVHFLPTMRPVVLGERALARSLSDIAAMGGVPRFCLVSLAIPRTRVGHWTLSFYRGLKGLGRKTGTELAGGDLAQSEKIYIDVMVCGSVARGRALRRDGARPGDLIYVSGALGRPWDTPIRPRLALGQSLIGKATACMDLSDGLSLDLYRMCLASKAAAEIDFLPTRRGATAERAFHGGEDYELLFTMPPRKRPPAGVIRIGRIVRGKPGKVTYLGSPVEPKGYAHFSTR